MYKTVLLLTAVALVHARPNEDAAVTNAKLQEVLEAGAARRSNADDDCETLDNGCPVDYTVHKIIPHERDCKLFYVCDKGERVVMSCPEPLLFDAVSERCVWSWQTDCVNDNSDIDLPIANDPEITTDADDVEPTTENGILDIGEVLENGCPADFHIHHLLPHEECEKFYHCNFGEKVERDCAPGTVFHFEIQVCDWPRNVPRCAGSAGATARPTTTSEAPATEDWEALPNGCPADPSINHLLPHESECEKYYACNSGSLVLMECPTATHFSPSLQICTWPHEAGCEHWTGGCSNPGSSCGGSTATPDNSTNPDYDISTTASTDDSDNLTTTETPIDSTNPDYDISTTTSTDVTEDLTTTEAPIDSTNPDYDISTTTSTDVTEDLTTTEAPIDSPNPDYDISTTASSDVTEDLTTTEPPIDSTTPDYDISTTVPTDVTEDFTTTEPPIDSTTDGNEPDPSTEDQETTTITEEPPCDTELPEGGSTASPGCPICPDVPLTPAEKCKQGCNVAPWAHEECDKYYSCIGDEFRLNICSEGLHFNPSTLTCDFICNAGCVRNVPQITRLPDGILMFVPNMVNSKTNMMQLIEHQLNGDL